MFRSGAETVSVSAPTQTKEWGVGWLMGRAHPVRNILILKEFFTQAMCLQPRIRDT